MAARGYSAGDRPNLVRSNTTVRYQSPSTGGYKRARTAGGTVRKQLLKMAETKSKHLQVENSTALNYDNELTYMAQGTGQHTRIGSRITVTGYRLKFLGRARSAQALFRVIMYRPRRAGDNMAADAVTVTTHIDPDKYIVMSDQLLQCSNTNGNNFCMGYYGRKFPKGLVVHYDDASQGAIENPIKMYITGYNTLSPDEHSFDAECFFKDM